jgi:hypothetical protein
LYLLRPAAPWRVCAVRGLSSAVSTRGGPRPRPRRSANREMDNKQGQEVEPRKEQMNKTTKETARQLLVNEIAQLVTATIQLKLEDLQKRIQEQSTYISFVGSQVTETRGKLTFLDNAMRDLDLLQFKKAVGLHFAMLHDYLNIELSVSADQHCLVKRVAQPKRCRRRTARKLTR